LVTIAKSRLLPSPAPEERRIGFADEGLVLMNQFHAALGTIPRSALDHFGMHAARVSVDVPAAVLV